MSTNLPQLLMRRPHLRDLPASSLPPGYALRHFRAGDEAGWNGLMDRAFEFPPGHSDFSRDMAADEIFRPERVLLITHGDGRIVATASCWRHRRFGEQTAMLHWVAAHPEHGGRQLGAAVSLGALRQAVTEGAQRAMLLTDDGRVAALRTYLRLDFEPVVGHASHRDRWRRILASLAWPERFEAILSGPLEVFD